MRFAFSGIRIKLLINIICIEKALKKTEIVFVQTIFYCTVEPANNGQPMDWPKMVK